MNIEEVLTRGVSQILPTKMGLIELMNKRKITLYCGYDPTAPSLHIGHLVTVRKLAQLQKMGHKVIFMFGDFTALVGDPTDKSATRTMMTKNDVDNNLKNYKAQVERVIDFGGDNPVEIHFNSHWLSKMNFNDIIDVASNFTVQQMIEREMFQQRIKNQKPIYLHEFLYPLMQGYDAVAQEVDLQIGGNDQLFNLMAGRTLMKSIKNKEYFALTTKLLEASNGKKMGKTEGNAINLSDKPEDMYGKIMSLDDGFIDSGIELLTDLPLDTSAKIGPMAAKKKWAFEVVKQIHGEDTAKKAEGDFEKTVQAGEIPAEIPVFNLSSLQKDSTIIDLLEKSKMVSSRGEGRRLIEQGAVSLDGKVIADLRFMIYEKPGTLKIGKRKWLKCN
ncbi:MAG: tyrosine--tRNA ligase [Patescibacteria group bacterium]